MIFLGIAVIFYYCSKLITIGTAYKAKMLCSEIFVAGRDTDAVLTDLSVDDLAALRFVDVSIDKIAKTVTANLFGLAKKKARYSGAFGCALVADDLVTPALWEKSAQDRQASANYTKSEAWPHVEPLKSSGVDNPQLMALLDKAFSEPDPQHPRRTRAIIILYKGRIVAERYAAHIGPNTPLLGWSMTKSVMNALIGILIRDGRLALDTPITTHIWNDTNDPRRHITLKHLLQMSSGLQFNEAMSDPQADVIRMLLKEQDMAAYAANKLLEADPGTRWQYSSGTTNILSGFLRRLLGDEAYHRFPREALFNRIGMTRAVIEADASGTFVGSSFMYATAREWARFGLLYLQNGVWAGERILPDGWVRYSRKPVQSDPQASYGAHFWLRIPKEYRVTQSTLPEDTFHAVGHEAQFITIVPSHKAVIIRLGKTRYPQMWEHEVFVSNVLVALSGER